MKPEDVTPEKLVYYHPIIGKPHDGEVYIVKSKGVMPSGDVVAWLEGKSGCVSVEALSPADADTVQFPEGSGNIVCTSCGSKATVYATALVCRKCGAIAANAWRPKNGKGDKN